MATLLLLLLAAIVTTFSIPHVASSTTIDVKGRCPDKCNPNTLSLFKSCAPLVDDGCEFGVCKNHVFACRMSPNGPPFYKLGEKVTITDHPIRKPLNFSISLLQAAPTIDVYFLLDATFTNRFIVRDAQNSYGLLIERLNSLGIDASYGLGIFRDESELSDGFKNLQSITKKGDKVIAALQTVEGMGGLDYFESNLVALYKVAIGKGIGWRKNSRKYVIMAAAFVGHEPTCTGSLPQLNRQVVANRLKSKSIIPVFYSAPGRVMDAATVPYGCQGNETAGSGQSSFITKQTNGTFIAGMARTLKIDELYNAVTDSLFSLSVDASTCERFANVKYNTTLGMPMTHGEGIEVELNLLTKLCQGKGNSTKPISPTCTVQFLFNGQKNPSNSLTLNFKNLTMCP